LRAVVQRVSSAGVTAGEHAAQIGPGLVVLVGVETGDGAADADYIVRKILDLRVFRDPEKPAKGFERSVQDVGGELLVVSQFTLAGDCRKGRRPSFDDAAAPEVAKPLYDAVVAAFERSGLVVKTGRFQEMMQVSLVNDGPVTLLIDSRKTF
jgi:D-aminoacyl-tRNA deacylase